LQEVFKRKLNKRGSAINQIPDDRSNDSGIQVQLNTPAKQNKPKSKEELAALRK
jgi:hypothetical protein